VAAVTLRERKRARTRVDLVVAALELFERNGYERTTIAEIAVLAGVGTRTFFSYFESKERVLFPDAEERLTAAVAALVGRPSSENLVDWILHSLRAALTCDVGMPANLLPLRMRLIRDVSSVHREALLIQLDAERRISRRIVEVYPGRVSPVEARAVTAGLVAAVVSAVQALFDGSPDADAPACVERAFRSAREVASTVWSSL